MIFYGSRGRTIAGSTVGGVDCPSCGKDQHQSFGIIRYFHLFWVPTFVMSRVAGIECLHCKRTLLGKEIPENLRKKIKESIFNKTNTLPMFSGLILLSCLFIFGYISSQAQDAQELAYIDTPMINDIYSVDFSEIYKNVDNDTKFGLMRIIKIDKDRVGFQESKLAYNKRSGPRKAIEKNKIDNENYFFKKVVYFKRNTLKHMKEADTIYSITRKQ